VIFALMTVAIIVVTHAVAYLTHEFSHSFTAWALGYMANPLALDYGDLTPANVVLLSAVGDNVPYDAILSGGHGLAVAVIALAGPFVGNALLYVCLAAFAARVRMRSAMLTSLLFWLMLMCAGNVWSYVPIRAITTHADIAIAASGLRIGVWPLFPVLLVPSLMVVGHFFVRTCPSLIPTIAAHRPARATLVIAVAATWFFTFFGGLGLFANYGEVAQVFSLVSFLILMPIAMIWLSARCSEPVA
jgi:hypothetical protein